MSPDEYCRNKLAAVASSTHYSLLFLPQERRRAASALFALRRELDEALERASDPSLAHASLHWWAQEIERLFDGSAQHPVTRALAPHIRTYDLAPESFQHVLQARHRQLQPAPFEDFEALEQHYYLASGLFGEMAAKVYATRQPTNPVHARQLALAVQIIRMVRDAGRHARAGRIVFPMQDLRRFDVKPQDLSSARYVDGFEALARLHAARARSALRAAVEQLAPQERRAQAPGIILGTLYEALLEELERSDFRVLHQRIALTPVRKLLIAWRTWVFGAPRGGALA